MPWARHLVISTHILISLIVNLNAAAGECESKTTDRTTALLELYTSEGCSSCPPADRWMNELPEHGYTRDRLVRLAWHVDYWNDLGWQDPFSQAIFTQRQERFVRRRHGQAIYTPATALSGYEYRWRHGHLRADVEQINRLPAQADITLRLFADSNRWRVSGAISVHNRDAPADVYLALYEDNLRSQVTAGENQGRVLVHSAVVRALIGPLRVGKSGKRDVAETIPLRPDWKRNDLGIAAFVENEANAEILQAVTLSACYR